LEYTLAVFDPEICCAPDKLECNRTALGREVNVVDDASASHLPLLSAVVRQCKCLARDCQSSLVENVNLSAIDKNEVIESKQWNRSAAVSNKSKTDMYEMCKDSGSDVGNDSFFDDLIQKKDNPWEQKEDPKQPLTGSKAGSTSMSSLAGLPSLTHSGRVLASGNIASVVGSQPQIIDLEHGDDKYDDDFQESNISPIGLTPRSARSDKNMKSLENDELDEEIEEEMSVGEDLLKSEASANDDLTTDRTLSPAEQSTAADYVEDVLHL
jgi:hypothetical protein